MTDMLTRDALQMFPPAAAIVHGVRRPVIYGRISQDRTGAGIKVAHQIADCRAMEAPLNLPASDVLSDNDMSAYSGKPRPGFDELIAGLESGRWNVLLIWHTDRLYRNIKDLERLVGIVERNGVEVHSVKGGKLDLSTAEGRMMARFLGVFAAWEVEHRSDRVVNGARGTVYRALNGKSHGGARRYGFACPCAGAHEIVKYDSDGNIVTSWHLHLDAWELEAERQTVAWLTREIIKGARTGALARQLLTEGIRSPRGGRWDGTIVKQLVLRPSNAGLVMSTAGQRKDARVPQIVHDAAGNPVSGQWDGIVTVAEWETARAILTDTARGSYHGRVPVSLLAGIGACHCGVKVLSGAHHTYVTRCTHIKRQRDPVDDLVRRVVVGVLESNSVTVADGTTVAVDNSGEIALLGAQLQRLEDLLADDDIDLDGYRRQRARKLEQIKALTDAAHASRAPGVLTGVTAESFATESLERQRAIVAALCTVTFLPSTGFRGVFQPDAIQILPRVA